MPRLSTLYLLAYNSLQAIGWTFSLLAILINLLSTRSVAGTYASSGKLISLLQCTAVLEVIHGAIGIVPSGVLLTLMQWGGRVHFLLAVVDKVHEVQGSPSVFITLLAWSISEVIRYSHYAFNCIGSCPPWITYLRYTGFIVLYPLGIGPGESESLSTFPCFYLLFPYEFAIHIGIATHSFLYFPLTSFSMFCIN
ncbi:very-long-chain (3R)-3-hydroxyacyl-CoA dehydratase 2 [Neltuma alba]|uniref:very-long-chain (3R)-3-hydroxyacyl-CoA dehydratase 2 n=1 Tax=Neltuma alba TaxID=207710 RepID=UPI0010A3121A|nr:very-long-chain (3R)-3-hydroxyacyl-CoA dehydratase 2-like [Prosopis alba]